MAKDDDDDSVRFSLNELRRVAPDAREARGGAPEPAAAAQPARAASTPGRGTARQTVVVDDDDDAAALLNQSLQSLRARVDEDKRRADETRRKAEEEQRLLREAAELEEQLEHSGVRFAGVTAQRLAAQERVAKLRAERKKVEAVDLERAGLAAESLKPNGIVLRPIPFALLILVFLGGLGGMAAYVLTRAPEVRIEKVPMASAGGGSHDVAPALARDFGQEIGWLAVGDVSVPPAAAVAPADDEGDDKPRRRRGRARPRRTSDDSDSSPAETSKKKTLLPPKPTGTGFVY